MGISRKVNGLSKLISELMYQVPDTITAKNEKNSFYNGSGAIAVTVETFMIIASKMQIF